MADFGVLDPDRLQVVLLGPGFGESVLVRVPGAAPGWLVVDSLLSDRGGKARSAVLSALRDLATEPDLVLLTHAHADHAGGMDILVERFRDRAAFGMLDLDFGTVASAKVRAAAQGQEVAAALRAIRQVPKDRRWDLGSGPVPLGDGSVTVLHPSEERLRQLIRMSSVGPNRFSSAVLIDWGERSVLLGADLERPEWVSLVEAPRLSLGNPIKVPHHGSPGAFDKTWVGDTATTPENASRRSLVAPFDKHPKLPDLDDDESIPGLLGEFTQVDLTSLPFKTTPTATGQWKLQDLRDARDAGIEENPPLPGGFRPLTSAQVEPNEDDAWVLAELSADGACDVRGGAASLNLTA